MRTVSYTQDIKLEPYWWEAIPRQALPEVSLPKQTDVAIVGGGYAGLSAALTLVRAGRSVIVLEAGAINTGASTRNGGQANGQIKISFSKLIGRVGLARAMRIYTEGRNALDHLVALIEAEGINCEFAPVGRFLAARTKRDYAELEREAHLIHKHLGIESELVSRSKQHREIGSDLYHGGLVRRDMAGLHPALFHKGLLDTVVVAGALVAEEIPVTGIQSETGYYIVSTKHGILRTRDVIVATNGYTGRLTPALRRRIIPIRSQMIATEPLAPGMMDQLIPKRRMVVDTCRMHHYYRPSPDGTRLLFGGRAGAHETDPRRSGAHLYHNMIKIFPQLQGIRITHTWSGLTGWTFDYLPHLGVYDGIYYVLGFCGSGVPFAPYLGHKLALRLLGSPEARTAFADQPLQTRPLYYGRPWFLPPVLVYYRLLDWAGI
ncbi:MAG: NAD(P)/FAD-dependent oxidoreductase [Acidiferrobacterales bacterium]